MHHVLDSLIGLLRLEHHESVSLGDVGLFLLDDLDLFNFSEGLKVGLELG